MPQADGNGDPDTIVFMHVPKCAGSSLKNSITKALSAKSVLSGSDLCLYGKFEDYESLDPRLRNELFIDALPNGEFEFVGGHMAYSTLKNRFPNARHMTVFREPAGRLISHFFYWRSRPEVELRLWGSFADWVRTAHGTLASFLSNKEIACQTDNLLTRFLLWPHPDLRPDEFISPQQDEALYRLALARLAEFGFVDLVENPALEQNLARWLKLPFKLSRDNETPMGSSVPTDLDEIDGALGRRIDRLTAIDLRLWTKLADDLRVPRKDLSHAARLSAWRTKYGASRPSVASPD
jgi:hypothetical protein